MTLDLDPIRTRLAAVAVTDGKKLGQIVHERQSLADHAPADLAALLAEVERLRETVQRVREMHTGTPVWELSGGLLPDTELVAPSGLVCLECSDGHVEIDIDECELDMTDAGIAPHPCPTIRALDGAE